jgi:uncharacterized protein YdaU (DUF1376 family)
MNGVRGLSAQEIGVYTMLLCRIYEESGPVEYSELRLSTYCGMRQPTFVKVVEKLVDLGKLTIIDGMLSNDRAEREISKRANDLKNSSKAGKASAEKRQQKQRQEPTGVERTFNHTDTDTDTYTEANASDEVPSSAQDFAKEVFDRGVAFLTRHGKTEPAARTMIGRWRKDHSDAEIFAAFTACGKAGAVDPVPWITARLTKPEKPPVRYHDFSAFGVPNQ